MGLFSGGNSTKKTTQNIDNSLSIDNSDNSFNQQVDNSQRTDNSVTTTTITHDGAFDVVSDAIDGSTQLGNNALATGQKSLDSAFGFGEGALDVSRSTAADAMETTRTVNRDSLDFGAATLDRSLDASESAFQGFTDSIDNSNRLNNQLITGAIDKTLAVASQRTATQSENVMAGVQKIALGLGAVIAVGFIANAVKKK